MVIRTPKFNIRHKRINPKIIQPHITIVTGKTDLAIKYLDAALVLEPDNGIYCLTLAKVLFLRDRIDEANATFSRGRLILMNSEP